MVGVYKKFCALLIALVVVFSMALSVGAVGTVTYLGNAEKFIFTPGTTHSPNSLFSKFQGVMPGDKLTDEILIKNGTSNGVKINLYMRSLGAQEESKEFLSQMELNVTQKDNSKLFAASADQTAQLTDWVYLGTIYSGGEISLEVTLDVPLTLDNTHAKKIGYLDWEFKVEELPIDPSDPQPPQTGSNMMLYICLLTVSVVGIILLFIFSKRKKTEKNN